MGQTIGIDVTSAVTQGGGIGRYTRELIQALAQSNSDLDYKLFHAKPPATLPVANPLPDNLPVKVAPVDEAWLYRLWYRLRAPLPIQTMMGRMDLFHSPDFVLPPTSGKIPTLLTVHDLSFVHFPEAYEASLVDYLNKVVPWSVERATHILADSEATRNDLLNLWHVPADKVTVLYCGTSEHFEPVVDDKKISAVRQKYHLDDAPYLLSVGTIQPRKNYKTLIRAFKQVADNWPHNLAIGGGKGWLFDDILAEVKANGLEDRVRFIGFVDDEDLPTLYSAASIYLFPSIYEGFGLPILEAMTCGVPVISSSASSLPEVVGDAGILLDPMDESAWSEAIHKTLLSSDNRTKMVANGFRQARKFSWQQSAKQLNEIYATLLSN